METRPAADPRAKVEIEDGIRGRPAPWRLRLGHGCLGRDDVHGRCWRRQRRPRRDDGLGVENGGRNAHRLSDSANYQTLPANSWFNLWFDLDSNQQTGDVGDEALVRYLAGGELQFYLWDGSKLIERSVAGITGRFEAECSRSRLRRAFAGLSAFGIPRRRPGSDVWRERVVASDYAPDRGRSAFVGPALVSFLPSADQDAAPDLTSVRVTDAKDGWISFAVSTPNYATVPPESVLLVAIDRDNRATTGDGGADALITAVAGEISLERWDQQRRNGSPTLADPRTRTQRRQRDHPRHPSQRARERVALRIRRHRGGSGRRGRCSGRNRLRSRQRLVLALHAREQGSAETACCSAGRSSQSPRAGKPFTISLPVRRSDTNRGITSGTVRCKVTADGIQVRATGTVEGGRARCSLAVPNGARAVRGSMTVRSGGAAVTARFSFKVR